MVKERRGWKRGDCGGEFVGEDGRREEGVKEGVSERGREEWVEVGLLERVEERRG